MTPNEPGRHQGPAGTVAHATLDAAANQLRDHVDQRWVEISDRVLAHALRATRRSFPVRGRAPGGPVNISEQVLVAHIRAAVAPVAGAAPSAIVVTTDDNDGYTGLTIELTAEYGRALLPIADRVRELCAATLTDLLGPVTPPVTVSAMHVHIGDVTGGAPR